MSNKKKAMQQRFSYKNTLIFLCLALYIASAIIAIWAKRELYADGAFFFADIINNKNEVWPYSNDPSVLRISANLFNQLLCSIALKLEITNINILRILFSIPLFFNALIGFGICFYICKKEGKEELTLYPLAAYSFFNIISEIFIINPAFTAFWSYYILLFLTLATFQYSIFDYILLTVTLGIASMAHESFLIIAPLIIGLNIYNIVILKEKQNRQLRMIISATLLLEIIYAFKYYISHETLTGDSYWSGLQVLLDWKNIWGTNILFLLLGAVLVVIFARRRLRILYMAVGFIAGLLYVIFFQGIRGNTNVFTEYQCRSLVTIGEFGTMILLVLHCKTNLVKRLDININSWFLITVIVLFSQQMWQIGNSMAWHEYMISFSQVLEDSTGIVSNELVPSSNYEWDWTQPSMSLVLSEDYYIDTLILPKNSYYTVELSPPTIQIPFLTLSPDGPFNYQSLLN